MTDWNFLTAARTLWQEVRGQPIEGQRAVSHVLWNRVKLGRWGNTLAEVCLYRSQFSAWGPVTPSNASMLANFQASCRLSDSDPLLLTLLTLITNAQNEPDPTNGATYYYNPKGVSVTPDWVAGATSCGQFGSQLFFKNVK